MNYWREGSWFLQIGIIKFTLRLSIKMSPFHFFMTSLIYQNYEWFRCSFLYHPISRFSSVGLNYFQVMTSVMVVSFTLFLTQTSQSKNNRTLNDLKSSVQLVNSKEKSEYKTSSKSVTIFRYAHCQSFDQNCKIPYT